MPLCWVTRFLVAMRSLVSPSLKLNLFLSLVLGGSYLNDTGTQVKTSALNFYHKDPEAVLLNQSSCLASVSGVANITTIIAMNWVHRHLSNIDCSMAHTTCLVCLLVLLMAKAKKKPRKTSNSSGHITNLKQSIFDFGYLWLGHTLLCCLSQTCMFNDPTSSSPINWKTWKLIRNNFYQNHPTSPAIFHFINIFQKATIF